MPDTSAERFVKVKEIVCDILELEEDEVTPDGLFKEDYGADSLRAIEILAALEKEFHVVIDQEELARMDTLNGISAVLDDVMSASVQ